MTKPIVGFNEVRFEYDVKKHAVSAYGFDDRDKQKKIYLGSPSDVNYLFTHVINPSFFAEHPLWPKRLCQQCNVVAVDIDSIAPHLHNEQASLTQLFGGYKKRINLGGMTELMLMSHELPRWCKKMNLIANEHYGYSN